MKNIYVKLSNTNRLNDFDASKLAEGFCESCPHCIALKAQIIERENYIILARIYRHKSYLESRDCYAWKVIFKSDEISLGCLTIYTWGGSLEELDNKIAEGPSVNDRMVAEEI